MADKLFGEIAVKMGFVTNPQVDEALHIQEHGERLMGRIMLQLGLVTEEKLNTILEYQKSDKGQGKPICVCAVLLGFITENQRAKALNFQRNSRSVLGDVLIELGYLTKQQRDKIVRQQFVVVS